MMLDVEFDNLYTYPAERRHHERLDGFRRVLTSGKLIYSSGSDLTTVSCLVVNISEGGVCVEVAGINTPEFAFLQISGDDLRPIQRCWAEGSQVGFKFLQP